MKFIFQVQLVWKCIYYQIRPLSTPFKPVLWPQSAIRMFGHMFPSESLIWAMNACTPWLLPFILSCEKTIVCVACWIKEQVNNIGLIYTKLEQDKNMSTQMSRLLNNYHVHKKNYYICCTTNPILLTRFTWSIDDKFSSLWIISSDCFNSSHL